MKNAEIRKLIKKKRLRYYEVAYAAGVSPETLSRWMRQELEEYPDRHKKVIDGVRKLIDEMIKV